MVEGFDFPLGVYPIDPIEPREGFTTAFEPADEEPGDPGDSGGNRRGDRDGAGDPPFPSRRGEDERPGEFDPTDESDPELDSGDDAPPSRGARRGPRPRADVPLDDRLPDQSGEFDPDRGLELDADDPLTRAGDDDADGLADADLDGDAGGDLDGDGEFEPWPDRYVWDINIRHSRLEALTRALLAIMPGRIYPILDVLGNDAYREVDPYMAVELVGQERLAEGLRRFRSFLFEDGLVGFGAMSEEPFVYVFIDEHKIVTVRAEVAMKERVDAVLEAFDLPQTAQLVGVDAATHEHRSVLHAPPDHPELLTAEEILEELQDLWNLELNLDPDTNLDEHGNDLGETGWRGLVRLVGNAGTVRYVESYLTADSLAAARDIAVEAAHELAQAEGDAELLGEHDPVDVAVLTCDRLLPEEFDKVRASAAKEAAARKTAGVQPRGQGDKPASKRRAKDDGPGQGRPSPSEAGEPADEGRGPGEKGGQVDRPARSAHPPHPGKIPGVILARWLD